MTGYVFRNQDGTLYFTQYRHLYKDVEKGRWKLGKGIHALQLSDGEFPYVHWGDDEPTQVDLKYGNGFDGEKLGHNNKVLAARNPAFLADTCVWNGEFFIMYNCLGEIEECGIHKKCMDGLCSDGHRIHPKIESVRAASELEICAFRQFIQDAYGIDPVEYTEDEFAELLANKNIKGAVSYDH